jgi:predicted RNA polymerase sigma factor
VHRLEAAIVSLHALQKLPKKPIGGVFIFSTTIYMQPTPVIELNKAIASFYVWDKGYALEQSQQIKGLENYLYYA